VPNYRLHDDSERNSEKVQAKCSNLIKLQKEHQLKEAGIGLINPIKTPRTTVKDWLFVLMNGDLSQMTSMHFSLLIKHFRVLPTISQEIFVWKQFPMKKRQVLEDAL
jgi:hypothetical protein